MTYLAQLALIYVLFTESDGIDAVYTGDIELNCARMVCAVLLHLTIIPEVR